MTFYDWLMQSAREIRRNPSEGFRESAYQLRLGLLRKLNPLFASGTNVYEREWDLMVVLDGCRTDAIAEVASEYEFLDTPGKLWSRGSTSNEWMDKTFVQDHASEIAKTVYISANPHSDRLNNLEFLTLEQVWKYGWDAEIGTVPAEIVTDVAIRIGRKLANERERMIVHYMQPHFPSVPEPLVERPDSRNRWRMIQKGEASKDQVLQSYMANLRYVLGEVSELLDNITASNVIITADHGNAKGEYGVFAHPHQLPLQCLREVPWYRTTAIDNGDRQPDAVSKHSIDGASVQDQLNALGYRM